MYYCGVRLQDETYELTIINEGESIILQTRFHHQSGDMERILGNRPRSRVLIEKTVSHSPVIEALSRFLADTPHETLILTRTDMESIFTKHNEVVPHLKDTHQMARLALHHWKTSETPEDISGGFFHELATGLDENEE